MTVKQKIYDRLNQLKFYISIRYFKTVLPMIELSGVDGITETISQQVT